MMRRISLRAMILLIVPIAGLLAFLRWNDPVSRYRRLHDAASLNAIMSRRVQNGDSLSKVELLLGQVPICVDPRAMRVSIKSARAFPSDYPQGVQADDEFRTYPMGSGGVYLQFRRGRLINFDPKNFRGSAAQLSGAR